MADILQETVYFWGRRGPLPPSTWPENSLGAIFFHAVTACETAETPCQINFFEKNILVEWKKVVLLQPFSTRRRENIETDEKREIACVGLMLWYKIDTKTSQKVKRTILTMKSLILAQDER